VPSLTEQSLRLFAFFADTGVVVPNVTVLYREALFSPGGQAYHNAIVRVLTKCRRA
jgi:hypothetical protein